MDYVIYGVQQMARTWCAMSGREFIIDAVLRQPHVHYDKFRTELYPDKAGAPRLSPFTARTQRIAIDFAQSYTAEDPAVP